MNMKIPEIENLEMIRTNPSHSGTSAISSLITGNPNSSLISSAEKANDGKSISFQNYLLDAVGMMNQQQLDVSAVQEKLITDPDSVDIHDVTTAMAKAQMSLSLAQTVVDRLVSGWGEITSMR